MSDNVVLGLDGGGTRTRVAVADLDGHLLGVAERGGASIEFNDSEVARNNLNGGVQAALSDAGHSVRDVAAFTAGIGGIGVPGAREKAERALDIDGLPCQVRVVSDAVVAHVGAFRSDPGIVAICGTGSLVFGITAAGEQISNYDCVHYARAGAHDIDERALHAILSDRVPTDWALADRLLDRWECESVADLREAVRDEDRFTNASSKNPFDSVAPLVTSAAADGDDFAGTICTEAVEEVVVGIRIVGGYLEEPISVTPAGSVIRNEYMTAELRRQIADSHDYQYVDPAMSPVAGAVFDAIDRATGANDAVVERLTDHRVGRT